MGDTVLRGIFLTKLRLFIFGLFASVQFSTPSLAVESSVDLLTISTIGSEKQMENLAALAASFDPQQQYASGIKHTIYRALVIKDTDSVLDLAYALRGHSGHMAQNIELAKLLMDQHFDNSKIQAMKAFFSDRSMDTAQQVLDTANSPLSRAVGYMCLAEASYAKGDAAKALMFSALSLAHDFSREREGQAKLYLTGNSKSTISLEGGKDAVIARLNSAAQSTFNPHAYHRYFTLASILGMLPEFPYSHELLTMQHDGAVHMCIAFDDNYIYHGAVALLSAALSANPNTQYVFHIAEDPDSASLITEEHRAELQKMLGQVSSDRFKISFDTFDLGVMPDYVIHADTARWPRTMLFRPYYSYFYKDLTRILSLDGDIIIREDLTALYNQSFGDNWIIGSRDLDAEKNLDMLGLDKSEPYLNGGVILFNSEAIRNNKLEAVYAELLAPGSEFVEKMRLNEQDLYPVAFKGHIEQIDHQGTPDSKWNWFYEINETSSWDQINASDYAILHLAGRSRKPWNRKSSPLLWTFYPWMNDGVQNLYWALREMTPWPNKLF